MSKLHIELTDEEHTYLKDNVTKLYERRDQFPADSLDAMGNSLDIMYRDLVEQGLASYSMKRRERRLLQIFIKNGIKALQKKVIPGYKARMITPKSKRKYKPYLSRAMARRDMLKGLLEKIEGGL